MKLYLDLLQDILDNGKLHHNRTGIDTLRVFGRQIHFDLAKGFPLLTTKKMFWKGICHELLWFLSGSTNIKYLQDNGVHIWDEWAKEDGEVGPMYGKQMRRYGCGDYEFDQLKYNVINAIQADPNSRRICMSTWNPTDLSEMVLAPCHGVFTQFMVEDEKLSCATTQRSADCFLGLPYNWASYALLTHMIAQVCGLEVGDLVYSMNDVHLYVNAIDAAEKQLQREPYPLPKLWLNPNIHDIDLFKFEDIKLIGYQAHPNDFDVKVAI